MRAQHMLGSAPTPDSCTRRRTPAAFAAETMRIWASASCGENGQARKTASTSWTARCKLRSSVGSTWTAWMFGAWTGNSPPGCNSARTGAEPLASSARTALLTAPVTSVTSSMVTPSLVKPDNFWSDRLGGLPVAVNAFRSNFLVRHSQQLTPTMPANKGDCRQGGPGALTLPGIWGSLEQFQ